MLRIVIKLLDQRSYSQIITDDVRDSHWSNSLMTIPNIICEDLTVKHVTNFSNLTA
jgi:hypothetical protein